MSQNPQVDPFDLCLADFTPYTEAQKDFCAKVETVVVSYATRLSIFAGDNRETVSSTPVTELSNNSCRGAGFLGWRMGIPVAETEGRVLFYDFYSSIHLFTVVDKCPQPLESDGAHYHLRYDANERDKGSSDAWKEFPVRVVLDGLKATLERLKEDSAFVVANVWLEAELTALE